jgi:hypothetical protein
MNLQESTEWQEEFLKIAESLKVESDRGCVLVVAALVENALEEHIAARLIQKIDKKDELMSSNKPIYSFCSKIDFAYRLGIIPIHERKIYHRLRELRNECAHSIEQQDFAKNHFKDKMNNIIQEYPLIWDVIKTKTYPNDNFISVTEFIEKLGWRVAFVMFFAPLIAHKKVSISRVVRIQSLGNDL